MGNSGAKQAKAASKEAFIHTKCRNDPYSMGLSLRGPVPDKYVSWKVPYPKYKPIEFTTEKIAKGTDYSDREENIRKFKFNEMDDGGLLDRRSSHCERYELEKNTYRPINPVGRTGITGRGRLGRFGPNKAADPLVTRWKRDASGKVMLDARGKKIMECVLILRKDTGEWAIPGGMVESGDSVTDTLIKEFGEEALAQLEGTAAENKAINEKVKSLFSKSGGTHIFQGYVDDPRNTDNAWMETTVRNFHDADNTSVGRFQLKAGDDAKGAQWATITSETKLYASHADYIKICLKNHGCL